MCTIQVAIRCLFVLLLPLLTSAQVPDSGQETAIRNVIGKYLEAREHRDPRALGDLFTSDADQLVSTGEWRRGRDAIVKGTLASSEATGGHRTITIQTVRLLSSGVAIADGPYELSGLIGGGSRKMWTTFLLVSGSDGWRITAIRNMRPAVPATSK